MADTEISPCLNKLEYMLLSDVESLHEVQDQLWSLHCMLTRLSSSLMEVQRKQSVDFIEQRQKAMENFVMEVMTLARGAEDDTDSYLNTIRREGHLSPRRDEAPEVMRSQIKKKMEALKDSHSRFVRSTQSSCASGTSSSSRRRPRPLIYQDDDDEIVVSLEDEVKKMIDLLLLEEEEKDTRRGRCDMIPIVGPGGMGKTTLARRVYNDTTIVEHFPRRLWIHVSSDYKLEEVLQDIIEQIKRPTTAAAKEDEIRKDKTIMMMSLKDLVFQTKKLLKTTPTRYLVVFDDVCKIQFWADIHMLFPNNKNKLVGGGGGDGGGGSRIIFTTRHDAVASHARPCRPPFYLRRLSKEESRELFRKRVAGFLHDNEDDDEDPHYPWEAWVDACGGIPVTLVALAEEYQRLMLTDEKYKEAEEKKGLVKGIAFPLEIWKLIYNHQPHHLKACLAYFYFLQKALKDTYFDFFDFKGLMVAEGLVKPPPPSVTTVVELELEDIAEEYVKELISRNLIQVKSRNFDGQIEMITIPNWIVSSLDQQNIYSLSSSSSFDSSSRMKIQNVTNLGGWVLFDEECLSGSSTDQHRTSNTLKARSLAISSSSTTSKESERSHLLDMGLLRVVINLQKPTESDIISYTRWGNHLRYLYLSAESCSSRTITEYLSELWNLQFLEIVVGRENGRLKLGKISQLRHILCYGFSLSLFIERKEELEVINSGDDVQIMPLLKNLQTLRGLDVEFCVEDILSMTPNLVNLRLSKGTTTIISQKQLDILPLFLKRLQKLELFCQIGVNPEICHQNITHLVFQYTRIDGRYARRALRKLQNLRVLEFLYGSISFTMEAGGGVLNFSSVHDSDDHDDWFLPHLKFLKLEFLMGLKEWKMSVGVMPSLQKVSIYGCSNIERLPSEALKAIPTLQELELEAYNDQVRGDARLVEEHLGKDRLKLRIT